MSHSAHAEQASPSHPWPGGRICFFMWTASVACIQLLPRILSLCQLWPPPWAFFFLPSLAFPDGPASILWVCTDPFVCLFHGRVFISVLRFSASVALYHWTQGLHLQKSNLPSSVEPSVGAFCWPLHTLGTFMSTALPTVCLIYTVWSSQGSGVWHL